MTAEEFLEQYPDAVENSMNLEDMACPHCGNRDRFLIDITSYATVTDLRQQDAGEMGEWDHDSYCRCAECEADGEPVRYFTIRGLDRLIRLRREQPVREPQAEDQHFL